MTNSPKFQQVLSAARRDRVSRFALAIVVFVSTSAGAQAPESAPATLQAKAGASSGLEDIVVTARKRDETSLAVPVVVSAVGALEIQRRAINNLDAIARIVPQLVIGPQSGSVQGGDIVLRGIAGPDANPFGDQAVSFNIDGVQVSKASVRFLSNFDLSQVEVLKGPQALFFGKNSPAGIISIRTADPTPGLEGRVSAGYEFNAREVRAEANLSGPLTDTLGFRVAGLYSDMSGFLKNDIPADSYVAGTSYARGPKDRSIAGRVTLKWEPLDGFDARLKVAYSDFKTDGHTNQTEYVSCAGPQPVLGSLARCQI